MSYNYIGSTATLHTGLLETSICPCDAARPDEVQESEPVASIVIYAILIWALASVGGLAGILFYCRMEGFGWGDLVAVAMAYVIGWGVVSTIFIYMAFAIDAMLESGRSDEAPSSH